MARFFIRTPNCPLTLPPPRGVNHSSLEIPTRFFGPAQRYPSFYFCALSVFAPVFVAHSQSVKCVMSILIFQDGFAPLIFVGSDIILIALDPVFFYFWQVFDFAAAEMMMMGVEILSFTIREISDNVGYLNSIGKTDIANVKKVAAIGVAEAERDAGIKESENERLQQDQR